MRALFCLEVRKREFFSNNFLNSRELLLLMSVESTCNALCRRMSAFLSGKNVNGRRYFEHFINDNNISKKSTNNIWEFLGYWVRFHPNNPHNPSSEKFERIELG